MKLWISILVLFLAVTGLCIWDGIHTISVFNNLETEANNIYNSVLTEEFNSKNLQNQIFTLNDYWTEKMDILSISISRKDLQPVSDYLQYLCSAVINNNQEDAITYARLLDYNITGLKEITGFSCLNLL